MELAREPAGLIQPEPRKLHSEKLSGSKISDTNVVVVKLQRADGGYLGTQRRRRTWLPTICSGELEAGIDPEVSEWGNPKDDVLNP